MPPTKAGALITEVRKKAGWSLRRLAREAHFSAGYLSLLENGQRPVTPKALGRIADVLDIPTYLLLTQGGFIPQEHLDEAEAAAERGLFIPSIRDSIGKFGARDDREWLVIDYLYMLGDDPYGTGWDGSPGHHADWTPLKPDAPERFPDRIKRSFDEWQAERDAPTPPTEIEGWNDLSDADKAFVQQMVNKLRRPTPSE